MSSTAPALRPFKNSTKELRPPLVAVGVVDDPLLPLLVWHPLAGVPLIDELDAHPGVEERLLPQPGLEGVVGVHRGLLKDLPVRLEAHGGAVLAAVR